MASSMAATSICMSSLSSTTQARTRISFMKPASFSIKNNSFPSLKLRSAPLRFRVACSAAKPETVDKVCGIVRTQLGLPSGTAVTSSSMFTELGADSLDLVETIMALEEAFGIHIEEESAETIKTVQDAADMIEKLVATKTA